MGPLLIIGLVLLSSHIALNMAKALLAILLPLSFPLFRSTVKRGDMGVFCCGINLSGKIQSHAMAVGGCLVAQPKGTSKPSMHALVVADGWNGFVRYVNVEYVKYTYNDSVFFSR